MGLERVVNFSGSPPSWQAIHERLAAAGLNVALRMIDGLPAFPDELPEDGWRELRISTPGGMMTLHLQPGKLSITVWGNAGPDLLADLETVTLACTGASSSSS